MVLKNIETPQELPQARYVARGFSDNMKHEIVHNVTSLRPTSIRVILSAATNLGFRLYCHDMVQAYLHLLSPLSREVCSQSKQKDHNIMDLHQDEILGLRNPLYCMCDDRGYWDATI